MDDLFPVSYTHLDVYKRQEFIVTMDDDLQHQPEELPKMINVMKERDDVDVIIASYEGRKHNLIRKLGTKLSVWALSLIHI